MKKLKVLVTGGAGYIGTHTVVQLIQDGYDVVILDNLSNSNSIVIDRIKKITGIRPLLVVGDIRDRSLLQKVFNAHVFDSVIHFAGLKSVGESVKDPLNYFDNNVIGTIKLLQSMQSANVKKIVFSSSATVYGEPVSLPINEDHPLSAINPYGRTKLAVEVILRDLFEAEPSWKILILRYFNPVGAHESGLIGEDPRGIPNNLMPYVAQVAVGKLDSLNVWGNDYPTQDGTGVRDYIHVMDLARGHIKALEHLGKPVCRAVNLGTGKGLSVLEVIKGFERESNQVIPYQILERRAGDVASSYADPTLAEKLLGWKAERDMVAMCKDHWRWQHQNPMGYS
jgi:UDP-glucose 4-epimerase